MSSRAPASSLTPPVVPPQRGTFCNRTLNLRAIRAIGYDMDYTLIHYREEEWEQRAYEHTRKRFEARGWPVGDLCFDAQSVNRGLAIDLELGNLVKANRFGYVIRASHGGRFLDFDAQRRTYARTPVELSGDRFVFLNSLFSYSEACIFSQLVDLFDARELADVTSYAGLYREVRATLNETHMAGALKAEMIADPDRFVVLDPETPLALLDQRHAGKKLLLITNSEWEYAQSMMTYAFDRYLPSDMTWRGLFDIVIVSSAKPSFFDTPNPLFEIVDEDAGVLRPGLSGLREGGVFFGGNAAIVEEHLGISGDEILYVGDHLFGDVHVSKAVLRWRTALILRELEEELTALGGFAADQKKLAAMMLEKQDLESAFYHAQLLGQRVQRGYGPDARVSKGDVDARLSELRAELAVLDERIAPLAKQAARMGGNDWGPLMRAGNDKSLFARQVERYADVYTSRVSNFLHATPFAFLRAPRGSLPHDPG